ncbi:MAG: preprotein translocase subunit SecE [Coriobacteriia bacterium]|nr:preprotein translocase subunit SecE [Coriobacteriia bacterium]MCL2537631.1 preprotein translocase subunit SecE [Coriobacteriia bacterium]
MAKDKKKNDTAKAAKPAKKGGPVQEKKSNPITWLVEYLTGVRAELKRVTWPSREKVVYLVGVVVVTLLFFAAFTAVVDWGASEGIVGLNSLTHDAASVQTGNEIPVEVDLSDLGLDATTDGTVGDTTDATDAGTAPADAPADTTTDQNNNE